MRKKVKGWTPPYLWAKFDNGREYCKPLSETEIGKAFYTIVMPQCTNCRFKGNNHKGDICIGDFWGINYKMKGYNKNGVSSVIIQTSKGQKLIEMLDDRFQVEDADYNYVIGHNRMYLESRNSIYDYNTFMENMNTKGLSYAVSKLPKEKITIKRIIKKIIPQKVIEMYRKKTI